MSDFDFSLTVSFKLAAQIGLEEAVLLSFLRQYAYVARTNVLNFEIEDLNKRLAFWTPPMILRTLSSLQAASYLRCERQPHKMTLTLLVNTLDHVRPTTTTSSFDAINTSSQDPLEQKMERLYASAVQPAARNAVQPSSATPTNSVNHRRGMTDFDLYLEQKERTRQPDQWQPEEATLEQITQLGITREFAMALQAEFLLRINGQRKNVRTWNSEFFKYVKRQWQYKQSDRPSHEANSTSTYSAKTNREQVSDALTNIHDTDW